MAHGDDQSRLDNFDFLSKITPVPFHTCFIALDLLDIAANRPLLDHVSQVCTAEPVSFQLRIQTPRWVR